MAKASVAKLVPKVPKVPGVEALAGATRRAAYSASTKQALVDAAERLFTEKGYAATSLDAIVSAAQVTKGALYHHFAGKQALFEAVFERVEHEAATTIQSALRKRRDPWLKAQDGLRTFLAVVQDSQYRRIVSQEGPAVLGYERFREQEERSTFAIIADIVDEILNAGHWSVDEATKQTFARIFFGALSSAGESVSSSVDPEEAANRVEAVIGVIVAGLQSLIDSGAEMPGGIGRPRKQKAAEA